MFNARTLALTAIAAAMALSATAEDRTIITSAPSADEYVSYLFTTEPPAVIKTRGIPTRGIRMAGAASSAAPSSAPSTAPAAAAPAAAPSPAPQPVLAAPVNFELDSATIPADFAPYLVNLAEAMSRPEAHGKMIVVSGHTDSQGADTYNLHLSMLRARAVETFLIERGVSSSQIVSTGKGESELLTGREADHAVNRRVEFKVAG